MTQISQNFILSRLSKPDFKLLAPHLEPADLPIRKVLERSGKPITVIYFPESGFASVVASGSKRPIEVGLIGREGMTGLPVILGTDRNSNEVFMQAAGRGQCLGANSLRKAIDRSVTCTVPYFVTYMHFMRGDTNRRCQWVLEDRRAACALVIDGR